jgi:hypothetical protein
LIGALLVGLIVSACGPRERSIYVYNNTTQSIAIQVEVDGYTTSMTMTPDQQGFAALPTERPRHARVTVLDPATCLILATTSTDPASDPRLPAEPSLVIFGPGTDIGVRARDPGDLPRVLLPSGSPCPVGPSGPRPAGNG